MQPQPVDLLSDFENHLVQASSGKRFANLLIDSVFFYFFNSALEWIAPVYPSAYMDPSRDSIFSMILLNFVTSSLVYCFLFSLMELLTNGRTVGKYLTGTRAVMQPGEKLTVPAAFLRGIIKCIPFEAFSALGSPCFPWHDRWSKSYVIDIKESVINSTTN